MRTLILILTLSIAQQVLAHPGGLDDQGGHTNRKTDQYHCHRDRCRAVHRQQEQAQQEAEEAGRAFSQLYDRDDWRHWVDRDGDCQDTRAELLIATSQTPVTFSDSRRCVVETGRWHDPYRDRLLTRASEVHIDHMVPLKHAHGHGGDRWSANRKETFANDRDNLLVVSAGANMSKGARSPDQWMPRNRQYWCEYVSRWIQVKESYALMITPPEQQRIREIRQQCRVAQHR